MSEQIQRRFLARKAHPIQLQERSDGALPVIRGYAAVFYRAEDPGTEFEIFPAEYGLPRVVERIMPGAFDRAMKSDDVRGLFNHDPAMILGRASAGTLRLSVDSTGLRYEIDPPDTQTARDLIQSLKRGDITGSSFAFLPRDTSYRDLKDGETQTTVIEQREVELFDVGPVTYPAYAASTSGLRSEDKDAIRKEVAAYRQRINADSIEFWLRIGDLQLED